jgi:hypothetical protein
MHILWHRILVRHAPNNSTTQSMNHPILTFIALAPLSRYSLAISLSTSSEPVFISFSPFLASESCGQCNIL